MMAARDFTASELGRIDGGLASIVTATLGGSFGRVLLVDVIFAIVVCALAVHASAVRLVFAMARDGLLPYSRALASVSQVSKTPILPVFIVGIAATAILVANINLPKLIELVTMIAALWANLAYLIVTTSLLRRRLQGWPHRDASENGYFSLGRFGIPVNIAALLWSVFMVVNIGWPRGDLWRAMAAPVRAAHPHLDSRADRGGRRDFCTTSTRRARGRRAVIAGDRLRLGRRAWLQLPIMPTRAAEARRNRLLMMCLGVAIAAWTLPLFIATPRASLPEGSLSVPAGFEIKLAAGPAMVNRPIAADFDEEGRLYVADSSGSNDKVEKQLEVKPHRIVRLEDRDGDGVFDRSSVFADRMMLPEGAMWFDGSLYVAAPPSIWKLTDTDDDGVADRREEWFAGKTLTFCANDLHGPYLGPDGWIYWTKGAFASQSYERPGKAPLETRAAHIFRRRPGSLLVEPVMTGGMDNPVEVAFTPSGERLFTSTFVEHPQLGRRDAIVHAIYGGVYGKPHDVVDGHPQTGDLMPVLKHLGAAVPSGLARYASGVFGAAYRDNLFVAQFNMQKVTRHVLLPSGATYTMKDTDFVTSTNRDFHPTDVLEDADGSLLVIDTGAWYKLCCPTSQLAKPDVLGGIYRVTRRGAAEPRDPRGRTLDWSGMHAARLARLLDDARPAVQQRAIQQLAKAGAGAVGALSDALSSTFSADARRNAVWALTRIDSPEARAAVRAALDDRDPAVRHAALHAAALWRDADALSQVRTALTSKLPAIRRVAAEALGRIGDARAVPDLLATSAPKLDRALEHSLTYALIEIADAASTRTGLSATSARTRRAALIALDQMTPAALEADAIVPLLDSSDSMTSKTAWWIAGRHREWGTQLRGYFDQRLAQGGSKAERDNLVVRLTQFSRNPAIEELLASLADGTAAESRLIALQVMAASHARELPRPWIAPLSRALTTGRSDVIRAAVAVARAVPPPADASAGLNEALIRLARARGNDGDVRLDALAAVTGGLPSVSSDLFELLRGYLAPAVPATTRLAAAGVLEEAALDRDQLLMLAEHLKSSGPLELPRLLPPFDHSGDDAVGVALVSALSEAVARSSVRPDVLRPRLAKYSAAVQQRGEALLASLSEDTVAQLRKLEGLLVAVRDGDPRRGQFLFNSPKAACSTCHTIGYQGGTIGPDLTSIGEIRTERDLLEAIVFPNASFARGYEPIVVTTKRGQVIGGLLRSDGPEEIVVLTGPQGETRIDKSAIANMEPGAVSLMPTGYGDQLSRSELADLLAFLKGTRWGAN
jgi:putative membrane-bound dehydrogenase-like protein